MARKSVAAVGGTVSLARIGMLLLFTISLSLLGVLALYAL